VAKTEDVDEGKCYVIPISPNEDVFVSGNFPLTQVEADRLITILSAMMSGLIDNEVDRSLKPKKVEKATQSATEVAVLPPEGHEPPDEPASIPLRNAADVPVVFPPSKDALHTTSQISEDDGKIIEDVDDGTYVIWVKVAARLESRDIDIFRCNKKTSSVHSVQQVMATRYPFLKCQVVGLPKGMSRIQVSRKDG